MKKYKLENEYLLVEITNVAGSIVSFIDKKSGIDIVLGYDDLSKYNSDSKYIGSCVGRVANRIENGRFQLDNQLYQLDINNGNHHLHGGFVSLKHKVMDVTEYDGKTIVMKTTLCEKDDHYPGDVELEVRYSLNEKDLLLQFKANTNKKTLVNLTNHSYFNLTGKQNLEEHLVTINSKEHYNIDSSGLISKEKFSNENSVFDFSKPTAIFDRLVVEDEQLALGRGFDHYFVCFSDHHATVETDVLKLKVASSYPGFQLYTANYLDELDIGKNNIGYCSQNSMCIECSFLPNGINMGDDSSVLDVEDTYIEYIKYTLENKGA